MFTLRPIIKFFIKIGLLFILCISAIYLASFLLGPPPISSDYVTILYDNNGETLERMNGLNEHIELDEMSPYVVDATIVTEDKDFYNHFGFDIKGIARAILKNIQSGHLKEGASTISQQYARNLYLTHEKTWVRKIKEAFYTIRLEMFYSKEEILTGYLNTIYYGHGAYGIESASKSYFNKHADALTISEAAMLAGIPKGPTYYSPYNNLDRATERQKFIIQLLYDEHLISKEEYESAQSEKITLETNHLDDPFASFYEDVVMKEAQHILGGDIESIKNGGYKIYTTLNRDLQSKLEKIIKDNMADDSDIEIGVVAIHPANGAVLSLIGGRDYKKSSFNRATEAKRMVGSTFKPFLYYAALENGYTPSTMLKSEPTKFTIADGNVYKPKNYNSYYAYKPISLAQAIALSDNVYAVKTNMYLKPETVVQTARQLGITGNLPNVPSLALGSASITIDEMVTAYGIIANGGKEIESFTIKKIINQQGKVMYSRPNKETKQILDENKTFILTHLMTGMFDKKLNGYMQVTGATIIPQLTRTYAGKSGTTDYDSWMIGFSPKVVTGVWTGYDNNQSIQKVAEKKIAKEVWAQFMEAAHPSEDDSTFIVPPNVVKANIDPETGKLATPNCPISRVTYFEKGTVPTEKCQEHFPVQEKKKVEEKTGDSFFLKLFELFKKRIPD